MGTSSYWLLGFALVAACATGGSSDDVSTVAANVEPDAGTAPDGSGVKLPVDEDGDGYAADVDCNDHDPAIHPKAPEICNNGKDDDCNGAIDDGVDLDNDGYRTCPKNGEAADCNDNDNTVHPHASEVCDGQDNDCNGKIDDPPASVGANLLAPLNTHWALAGNASIVNGAAQLTPDALSQAGALWWNASYTFENFDMLATFFIQAKANGADGMAFAWVPGNNVASVGTPSTGFGVYGLGGWAVAIDTYLNDGDPPVPFLTIVDGATSAQIARQGLPAGVHDGADHTLRVKLATGGKVTVAVDGVTYFTDFVIPSYAPFAGHWGFTGGTGGLGEIHGVRNATISFPDQGCVK